MQEMFLRFFFMNMLVKFIDFCACQMEMAYIGLWRSKECANRCKVYIKVVQKWLGSTYAFFSTDFVYSVKSYSRFKFWAFEARCGGPASPSAASTWVKNARKWMPFENYSVNVAKSEAWFKGLNLQFGAFFWALFVYEIENESKKTDFFKIILGIPYLNLNLGIPNIILKKSFFCSFFRFRTRKELRKKLRTANSVL